jgi:eukaryotic-like serine/threonine-protein kinase
MSSQDLEPGSNLGRFTVEGILGRGGMGVVYKVRDPHSKMPYAAKVLNRASVGERDFVKRFKTEAKTAKRFSHMNIVHAFKLRRWEGTYFYVMELVDGRPLDEAIRVEEMSRDRALGAVRDLAAALDFIHSKRFVHRDVKPDNVLIRADGHVKLLDFGLAQRFGRVTRTKSGHVMGTAKYMAPELIQGTVVYPETDIYALGVVMYELVAGRPPFEADHGDVLMDMHLYVKHKPLVDAVPGTDRNLSSFIDRMLVKDPSRRATSARTVNSWLEFYLTKGWFADVPKGF